MEITIVGTGNMGRSIATRVLKGAHSVTLLGTEADKGKSLADELSGDVRAGAVGDPLSGDVVFLAVWYPDAVNDVLAKYSDQLDGKVVVDITKPIDTSSFEPLEVDAGSAAQDIAARAPGARVVKAFNTTFAGTLVEGEVAGHPLDVFIASDDDEAKATVRSSLRTVVSARSMQGRWHAPASSKRSASFTWRSRSPLGTGYGSTVKVLA